MFSCDTTSRKVGQHLLQQRRENERRENDGAMNELIISIFIRDHEAHIFKSLNILGLEKLILQQIMLLWN